ncbi:MAG: hypothetical protein PHD86_02855 [Kiritimatiellae bacterium]|nr:hypothetical protein [Kiritimatiellia bacterium]
MACVPDLRGTEPCATNPGGRLPTARPISQLFTPMLGTLAGALTSASEPTAAAPTGRSYNKSPAVL